MNKNIDLSIIIVNYKTPDLTDICIGSIYKFTTNIAFEVIVIDNDSQDNSETLITQKYPAVKWINSGQNAGTSVAYNIGIRAAIGQYLLILNSDTEFVSNTISVCLDEYRRLEKIKKIGLLGCQIIGYDHIIQYNSNLNFFSIKNYFRANPIFIRLNLFQNKITEAERLTLHKSDHETQWLGIPFGILNADICKKDNLYFDEDIFMYYDDEEYCYRLLQHDYVNQFTTVASVLHLNGGSSTGFSEWRHGQITVSRWMFFLKQKGVVYFCACIFVFLLNHFLDNILYIKSRILNNLKEPDFEQKKIRRFELSLVRRYFSIILLNYDRNTSSGKTFLKYELEKK